MRKQYHARPVGEDVHIWDVHKLVRAAKTLPAIQITPESVAEIDAAWWFGDGNAATPRAIAAHFRLAMAVDPTHPILLCAEGRLMDGMPRVVRALAEGRETLPARRFTTTPPPDFKNVALEDLPYPDEPVWARAPKPMGRAAMSGAEPALPVQVRAARIRSRISRAADGMFVPGPKIALTPASCR